MERTPRKLMRATQIVAAVLCPLFVAGASALDGIPQETASPPRTEFEFVRLIYPENPEFSRRGWGFGGYRWMTDAPEAETHLLQGIHRLTRINAASEGMAVRLDDDAVFDHPFLYA